MKPEYERKGNVENKIMFSFILLSYKETGFSFEDVEPRGAEPPISSAEELVPQQCLPYCKYTLRATELSLKVSSLYLTKEQRRILKSAISSKKTKCHWQTAILGNVGSL